MEARADLRAVAVPREHGGWGLTLEPGLLGLLLVGSAAGVLLATAAMVAFVARTPLRVVAVDLRRHRWLHRTRVAATVAAVELVVLLMLVGGAAQLGSAPFWWPALLAGPLVAVEGWFDVRSQGRRLVPELAGAAGVGTVAAMVVLAGGGDARLAAGASVLLIARVATSIPHVRAQIARVHGRPAASAVLGWADAAALLLGTVAVALEPRLLAGAAAVGGVVVLQRVGARRPLPRVAVLGLRQMALGLGVVVAAAVGVHAPWA